MVYKSDNNHKNIAHYFNNPSINKYNNYTPKLKLFYTKLKPFYTFFN